MNYAGMDDMELHDRLKSEFPTVSSQELNCESFAELSRRRDELRFLRLQYDFEKGTENLRFLCIERELAEVERKIYLLSTTAKSLSDEERFAAEEDLLRQERIG